MRLGRGQHGHFRRMGRDRKAAVPSAKLSETTMPKIRREMRFMEASTLDVFCEYIAATISSRIYRRKAGNRRLERVCETAYISP